MKKQALLKGVQDLLQKRAIVKVPVGQQGKGTYSILFLVKKPNGDYRPVLDLKSVNLYIPHKSFKMVTLQMILPFLSVGDFLASLDLRDAYLHVPVHQSSQRFLRFCVEGEHFQFQALPFGLSSSPRVFTKVLAPLVGLLHAKGIQVFPYLDDWLISSSSFSKALSQTQEVCGLLERFGWLINQEKSHLTPSQELLFIGGVFNTMEGKVFLSKARRERLL